MTSFGYYLATIYPFGLTVVYDYFNFLPKSYYIYYLLSYKSSLSLIFLTLVDRYRCAIVFFMKRDRESFFNIFTYLCDTINYNYKFFKVYQSNRNKSIHLYLKI